MATQGFPTAAHLLKALGHQPRVNLGDLGSAVITPESEQFTNRHCLTPDFPDLEVAQADVADLVNAFQMEERVCKDIREMHRRFIAQAATGSGSWPPGNQCHPNEYPFTGYHATKVWVDYSDFMKNSSLNREVTDQEWQEVVVDARVWPSLEQPVQSVAECKRLWVYRREERAQRAGKQLGETYNVLDMGRWLAFEATRRVGLYLIEMFDGPDGDHNIHIRTYPMPGSLSGLGYFPDGGCNDHVTCNLDSLINYGLGWFTGLLTHELGHCINFRHEFASPQSAHRSILSYAQDNSPFQGYRKSGTPYQYREDHSWPAARRFFGGEAAKAVEEIKPPPPDGRPTRIVLDPVEYEEVGGKLVITNTFAVGDDRFYIARRPSL